MNEKDRKELITHILDESRKEAPAPTDDFENALFEARVRNFLIQEATK